MAESKSTPLGCFNCGHMDYHPVNRLERHPNEGVSPVQAGFRCNSCGTMANIGASWQKIQIDRQRLRMEQLQEEAERQLEGMEADSLSRADANAGGRAYEIGEQGKAPVDPSLTDLAKSTRKKGAAKST